MRRTPMRRTGFKSKLPSVLVYDHGDIGELRAAAIPHCKPLRRGVYGLASNEVVPVPKAIKAKPGKRAPTADEREWMEAITAYGCVCCRMDGRGFVEAAVHHILRGGRRIGHLFTIPLCDPGHHQNGQQFGMTSRHPWKARFEQRYGNEFFLLRHMQLMLLTRLSFDPREVT